MKKIVCFVLMMALSTTVHGETKNTQTTSADKKKLGLVLGGGGAKGVAHIGVLKVLERAGIPIDIIAGTSMGSIIGGTYACGHRSHAMDSVVRSQDWTFVLSDKDDLSHQSLREREKQNIYFYSKTLNFGKKAGKEGGGLIMGKNIASLFDMLTSPYNDSIDFNKLPIPFACVATDIATNTEYVFHQGVLSRAMRASMAIPGVFAPVRKDSMVLIDGGLRNNFPVDVARNMGADYVIGVDVGDQPKPGNKLVTAGQILTQITDWLCMNKYDENVEKADIVIRVNTDGYSAASFTTAAIDTLIRRGEEAAMEHWDEIVELGKRIGRKGPSLPALDNTDELSTKKLHKIGQVRFVHMTSNDERYLRRKFDLEPGDSISIEKAEIITTAIRYNLHYQTSSYRIQDHPGLGEATVILTAGHKQDIQVNLGARFDNEEMAALQANAQLPIRTKIPMDLELTLRLGKRVMARMDWTLPLTSFFQPTISYTFRNNDINFYESGDQTYTMTYNQHTVKMSLFNFNVRNFNVNIGANWDYYNYHSLLVDRRSVREADDRDARDKGYVSYEGRVWYNSENDWNFPSSGVRFHAKFAYITDNFVKLDGRTGIMDYSAMLRATFPLSKKVSVQPMVYGRALVGEYVPVLLNNLVGGEFFDKYVEGQMPFAGVGYLEMAWEKFAAAQLQLQYKPTANNNILMRVAAAQNAPHLKDLLDYKTTLGASLSYYYSTPLGPLGGSIGYSNRTKKFYYYINLGFVF